MTLQRLHLEYLAQHADGYRYSQFCRHYERWVRTLRPTMRQVHRVGEKAFVDFSGKRPVSRKLPPRPPTARRDTVRPLPCPQRPQGKAAASGPSTAG